MQHQPMRSTRAEVVFGLLGLSFFWLASTPLLIWIAIRLLGWPLLYVTLVYLPVLAVFIPASYPIVIAGNEHHQAGAPWSADVLARSAIAGVLIAAASASSVWSYILWASGFQPMTVLTISAGLGCIAASLHLLFDVARRLRAESASVETM